MLNNLLLQNTVGDEEDQIVETTSIRTIFNTKKMNFNKTEPKFGIYLHNFVKCVFVLTIIFAIILLIVFIVKKT